MEGGRWKDTLRGREREGGEGDLVVMVVVVEVITKLSGDPDWSS